MVEILLQAMVIGMTVVAPGIGALLWLLKIRREATK